MKNLLKLSFFTAITLIILSCSNDDKAQPITPAATVDTLEDLKSKLIGKWQYEKIDKIVDATEVLVDYTHPCATKKDNFILALDNSYDPVFFCWILHRVNST